MGEAIADFGMIDHGDRIMVCRLRIAPHTVTAVHSHPHEQITHLLRGRLRLTVANVPRELVAGQSLCIPGGTLSLNLVWSSAFRRPEGDPLKPGTPSGRRFIGEHFGFIVTLLRPHAKISLCQN